MTNNASSLHPLFSDGPLQLGEPQPFATVPRDYATEFAAREYLAVATLGQPVGVGALCFGFALPQQATDFGQPYEMHDIDLAIIPGRGVWVLAPVFDDWTSAERMMAVSEDALRRVLERPLDGLPLGRAFVPVVERVRGPRPWSVDPSEAYDHTLYRDVIGTLRPACDDSAAIDTLIDELLSAGDWVDGKELAVDTVMDNLPEWLAVQLEAAGIEGLHHFDPRWRRRAARHLRAL